MYLKNHVIGPDIMMSYPKRIFRHFSYYHWPCYEIENSVGLQKPLDSLLHHRTKLNHNIRTHSCVQSGALTYWMLQLNG